MCFHLREFCEPQYPIVIPVQARNLLAVEPHLFVECTAKSLHQSTFDLVDQAVGVENKTAIECDESMLECNFAGSALNLDINHQRRTATSDTVAAHREAAPRQHGSVSVRLL